MQEQMRVGEAQSKEKSELTVKVNLYKVGKEVAYAMCKGRTEGRNPKRATA